MELVWERHQKILNLLAVEKRTKIPDLIKKFNVSEMTIRNDISALRKKGLVKKIYGGVELIEGNMHNDLLGKANVAHLEEKQQIAKAAMDFISDDSIIILDAGTTTQEIAYEVGRREWKRLSVITNSIAVALALSDHSGIELTVTGGDYRPETRSLVGPMTVQSLEATRADLAIIGAAGLTIRGGLTSNNLSEAASKIQMAKSSSKILVPINSSKIGKVAIAPVMEIDEVDILISDGKLPTEELSALREKDVKVVTG